MTQEPNADELNAYVDGELTPDRAARVAEAIARDRELAQEVAALLRLKTATIAAFDAQAPALPQLDDRPVRRRTARWVASAAMAAMVLSGAIAAYLATSPSQSDPDRIWALIDQWGRDRSQSPRLRAELIDTEARDAGLARLLHGLTDLRLQIIRSEAVAEGMAFDLLGPSGCRLAVWAGPGSVNLATAPALQSRLRTQAAIVWQAGGMQYLLLSHNTAEQKLAAMAAVLQRATQDDSPVDKTTLSLVAEARTQASPCVT
jgi:anti-sigma factor RsiW